MLKWWVGLVQAVETIRESTDNYAVKDIAIWVKKYLETWKSLSYALTRLPDYFDEWDYSVVRAGEKSGNLPLVLESLATEYEYMKEIKNKYMSINLSNNTNYNSCYRGICSFGLSFLVYLMLLIAFND